MNITVNVQRSIVAIGVLVTSAGDPRSSLIASVSYNGVKLATTGGEVSLWTYTTDESYISDTWWTSGYDDSLWTLSDTTAQCNADTAPVTNRDGMSYSQLISANGIAPEYDSPQYGGTTARWIGLNGNSGICTSTSTVAYRIVLDLNTLAAEPTCYPAEDGRSFLSLGNPMMRFPSIGPRTKTSRVVSFVGGADNELAIWADGMGALGPRGNGGKRCFPKSILSRHFHLTLSLTPDHSTLSLNS